MEQPGVVVWGDICPGMQDFAFKDAVYALSPYMIPFTLHSGACKHLLSEAPSLFSDTSRKGEVDKILLNTQLR
jgi:hypothetical protein